MNEQNLFSSALGAQNRHVKFLQATEGNLSTYYFGRKLSITANSSTLFPKINMIDTIMSYKPDPYNPMQFLINAFVDEIIESEWTLDIESSLKGQENLTDLWEDKLNKIHSTSKRRTNLRRLLLEMFFHAYFAMYFDGSRWWPLTAYDIIPGDPSIPTWEDQPYILRLTKAKKKYIIDNIKFNDSCLTFLDGMEDLDDVMIYDIWCKDLNANIAYLQNGQPLYKQEFPVANKYPFFGAIDTEMVNSFYTVPVTLILAELLAKFQNSLTGIEKNSKSTANPLLVYDVDSGIDIDQVVSRMREDYKQIVVGKNREGDIGYKAPASMPSYAVNMPDVFMSQMMRHLGINDAFLGNPMAGVRERGALTNLIKASFRKLESKVILIEEAFTDMDNYILDFYGAHKDKFSKNFDLKTPEEFFVGSKLTAIERLTQFLNKDTSEEKNLTMNKYRGGLISQRTALKELGHMQPDKIIKEQREEAMEREIFKVDVQKRVTSLINKNPVTIAYEKLKGRLQNKFWLVPIDGDRVVVRVSQNDRKEAAKLLIGLDDKILIKVVKEKEPVPSDQVTMEVPLTSPPSAPVAPTAPAFSNQPRQQFPQRQQFTRQPVAEPAASPAPEEGTSLDDLINQLKGVPAPKVGGESGAEKGAVEFERETQPEIDELINATLANKEIIEATPEMMRKDALYFNEPIAKNMAEGKQMAFIKPKRMNELIDEEYLLAGKQIYGILTVRQIINDFDFENTFKYHRLTDASRQKNWGDSPLYLYIYDFKPFKKPVDYTPEPGARNIIKITNAKI